MEYDSSEKTGEMPMIFGTTQNCIYGQQKHCQAVAQQPTCKEKFASVLKNEGL